MSNVLGQTTGTFDHKGERITGPENVNLAFPRYQFSYAKKIGDAVATAGGFGGTTTIYSASFKPTRNTQDYDLQTIISGASATGLDDGGNAIDFSGVVGNKRVVITRVCGMRVGLRRSWIAC